MSEAIEKFERAVNKSILVAKIKFLINDVQMGRANVGDDVTYILSRLNDILKDVEAL